MRVASFNLFSGRALAGGIVEAARVRSAVAALDADVVGLQEVDRAQSRSQGLDLTALAAQALGVGTQGWRFAPALIGTPGQTWVAAADGQQVDAAAPAYGVGLVSRLPVREWRVIRLPSAPVRSPVLVPSQRRPGRPRAVWLPDEPRVGLVAVVDAPGVGLMTVATTHLSFVPAWNLLQLRRLVRVLERLPHPVLLLGDLNIPGGLPRLAAPGWLSLARTKTWPAPQPRVQFDHLLAHGQGLPPVTRVQALELAVSDHRALVVDLGEAAGGPALTPE